MSHSLPATEPSAVVLTRLLAIQDDIIRYLPLTLDPTWRSMLYDGLIRVCPYPEEDVVLLPKGLDLLARASASAHVMSDPVSLPWSDLPLELPEAS